MKYFIASLMIMSLFLLNSCSPKSSQPCPRVAEKNVQMPVQSPASFIQIHKV